MTDDTLRATVRAAADAMLTALKRSRDFKGGLGTLALTCAQHESDRECVDRHRREIDQAVNEAIAMGEVMLAPVTPAPSSVYPSIEDTSPTLPSVEASEMATAIGAEDAGPALKRPLYAALGDGFSGATDSLVEAEAWVRNNKSGAVYRRLDPAPSPCTECGMKPSLIGQIVCEDCKVAAPSEDQRTNRQRLTAYLSQRDSQASPEAQERMTDQGVDAPFRVEVDKGGCERCGHGTQWTVVGPDDVAIGQSFEDQELADDIAEYMNQGFKAGCGGE